MAAITGPISLYANLPIEPQFYSPWRFVISGITLGRTTTVTLVIPPSLSSAVDLNYIVGQQVRLIIPPTFGCRQLNEQTAYVISLPSSTQVTLNLDSTNSDPYVASSATTPAQLLAIGDISNGFINSSGPSSEGTYIPGAFINVSPN